MQALPDPFSLEGRDAWKGLLVRGLYPPAAVLGRLHRATLARSAHVVAVVGTYGKTTTTRGVTLALGLGENEWTRKGRNCYATVPAQLLRQGRPGATAVIEVGIGAPGEMRGYARILRPDTVVVTSIGSEHGRMFDRPDGIREEKADMVRALSADGTALLNRDDPEVMWMASQTRARVLTFGFHEDADVRALDASLDWPRGTVLTARVGGRALRVSSGLVGRHSLHALLAALAVAQLRGRDLGAAAEALAGLAPARGRLVPVPLDHGAVLLCDDFKGSLETIHSALDLFAEVPATRRIAVLGGIESPPRGTWACYREVGAHLARTVDEVIFVGVHSRELRSYRAGGLRAGLPAEAIHVADGVHEAVAQLRERLGPGDVALVKGRAAQKMMRVALALQGRKVGCHRTTCSLKLLACDTCPRLEHEAA